MMGSRSNLKTRFLKSLFNIDRRLIYVLIALSLSIPLVLDYSLKPAPMKTAEDFFQEVEKLSPTSGRIVLIAADWGPSTQAENKPQTLVAIEHLMRRRIPFALISILQYATPYLENMPKDVAAQLEKEHPGEKWVYGKDWVNFGFQPGATIMIQGFARASDIHQVLKTDALGTPLEDLPIMKTVHTIRDISMLMEFTGSVGAFNYWLQFFQSEGYQPPYLHGCTSVSIPDAFNYYVSHQIRGLFEGVSGAAWYEELLSKQYPKRRIGQALRMITGISVAHLVIIFLIVIGNIGEIVKALGRK